MSDLTYAMYPCTIRVVFIAYSFHPVFIWSTKRIQDKMCQRSAYPDGVGILISLTLLSLKRAADAKSNQLTVIKLRTMHTWFAFDLYNTLRGRNKADYREMSELELHTGICNVDCYVNQFIPRDSISKFPACSLSA